MHHPHHYHHQHHLLPHLPHLPHHLISRNEVAQSNSCERDEAIVERIMPAESCSDFIQICLCEDQS